MYNKVCLIGPQRLPVSESQVRDALDFLTDRSQIACLLVGSLSGVIGTIAGEFALDHNIPIECIEAKHEELGNEAMTRQMWDFIGAGTDLFVILPPFDVQTHNMQVLATYSGCAQWVPYDC
jgi:hypothetical protein